MGPNSKGKNYERILSGSCREIKNENKNYSKFQSMVRRHGNLRSYSHRFKIIETPICPCGTNDQTIDNFLFECEMLNKEIDRLILTVSKTDIWPISKNELIQGLFTGKPDFFYRGFIANTEIIKLSLFNIVPC